MYCAIIGDMIDSRFIEDRSSIQRRYVDVLDTINKEYESNIAACFKIRDGDGFHGLLKDTDKVMEIILRIRLALTPVQIRIGIGVGTINTEIKRLEIQQIDGRAFVIAREALDCARDREKKYEAVFQNTSIRYEKHFQEIDHPVSAENAIEDLINLTLCACSLIEKSWSEKQAEAINLKIKELSQREIARELNIEQASVFSRLKLADFYTYRYCMNQIQQYINMMWRV